MVRDWPVEKRERRKLDRLLDALQAIDRNLAVGTYVFKRKEPHIYYSKINGPVALRPRLCFGPIGGDKNLTFLARAEKKDGATSPANVDALAAENRQQIREKPMVHWKRL